MGRLIGLSAKEQLLDARAATWAGLRVVVADVGTTSLNVASSRVEDAITTEKVAETMAAGCWGQLARDGITRATRGRLLDRCADPESTRICRFAAGYGAQLAAQAGAQSRRSGRELTPLAQAWNAGSRNAKLADQCSNRLLVTAPSDATCSHLDAALDVCNAAIATQGGAIGKVWDRLCERRDRIIIRQYAKPKTPPATTRNKRPARVNRYAVPAEPVAPAAPEAAARRKVKSSQATKAPRPSGR